LFVTLEGVDGAGKSTQARLLADALGPETLLLREPGGTVVGESVRQILKNGRLNLDPRAELLLFCAARAQLVEEVIRPAIGHGLDVVCDRFVDSTVAYQGVARGLGEEYVNALNSRAVEGCWPDCTVLLRVSPDRAQTRTWERKEAELTDLEPDRFEREGLAFQERVAAAFEELAEANPARFVVVDAEGSVEEVHARVREALGL
jgi:dTMP kinase